MAVSKTREERALSADFVEIVAHQKRMNRETHARLVELGLAEDTEVVLDFFYAAPGEDEARALAAFLEAETDYVVAAGPNEDAWAVSGSTRPTRITLPLLDDWVAWMAAAGWERRCLFDGWGTSV